MHIISFIDIHQQTANITDTIEWVQEGVGRSKI